MPAEIKRMQATSTCGSCAGEGVTFSQLLDIQEALEAELGKPLDIATAPPGQMRPSFYNRIVQNEVSLYVA